MRRERSIELDATPDEIWPWLTDPVLLARWSEGSILLRPDPRFPAANAWAELEIRAGGRSLWRARVADSRAPHRLRLELEGFGALAEVRATLELELEEWIHTTRLLCRSELPFSGSGRQKVAALGGLLCAAWSELRTRRLLRRLARELRPPAAR